MSLPLAVPLVLLVVVAWAVTAAARGAEGRFIASAPAWSPDGRHIAFIEGPPGESSLYVMDADGRNARVIVGRGMLSWPSWSPEGRRLAFSDRGRIAIVSADGTGVRHLARGLQPAWGPGGRLIAFARGRGSNVGIEVVSPDGTRRRVAAMPRNPSFSGGAQYGSPAWSPDGEKLALYITPAGIDNPDTSSALGVISRFGGPVSILLRRGGNYADWSRDGGRIVFTSVVRTPLPRGGAGFVPMIEVLQLRTKKATRLRSGEFPRFSPDGRQIVFADGGRIYVMDADGTHVRALTE